MPNDETVNDKDEPSEMDLDFTPVEKPEVEDKPAEDKPTEQAHNFDKGLSQTQARLARIEREFEERLAERDRRVEELMARLDKPRAEPDDFDRVASTKAEDFDPHDATQRVASAAKKRFEESDTGLAQVRQRQDDLDRRLVAQERLQAKRDFERDHPTLAKDYDAIMSEAVAEYQREAQGVRDPQAAQAIWRQSFRYTLAKAQQTARSPQQSAPLRDEPVKAPIGASDKSAPARRERTVPRTINDEIPDFSADD